MRSRLTILLGTQGTIYFAGALFAPLYAVYVADIGGELITAGTAAATFAAATGFAALFAGKLAARFPHPKFLAALGWTVLGIGFLGYLFVKNPAQLFAVQILLGLATAAYFPPVEALYSRYVTRNHAGARDVFEWSWWDAVEYWTQAGGALAGGLIATFFGFPTLFIIMAGLAFLSAGIILAYMKR